MRAKLIKLAYYNPHLRKSLLPVIKKADESKFQEFLEAEGDRQVPNPNPKSRDRFPKVKIKSLSSSEEGVELAKKLYKAWLGSSEKTEDSKDSEDTLKELPPLKTTDQAKVKPFFNITSKDVDKYLAENSDLYDSLEDDIVAEGLEDYEGLYEDYHGSIEGVEIPDKEKKMAMTAHLVGRKISQKLTEKFGDDYDRVIGRAGGWGYFSMKDQTAVLQGILSDMGVKGHFSVTDGPMERKLHSTGKEHKTGTFTPPHGRDRSFDVAKMREMVKETYIATQAYFKSQGITEVTLFRGVQHQIDGEPPKVGDTVSLKTRELSSWTTDPTVGLDFGRVVVAKIPVEQVLSGYMTDPVYASDIDEEYGAGESEFLILESSGINAKVVSEDE